MKTGFYVVAAAFLIAGAGMVVGIFGASDLGARIACIVLALLFLPVGIGALVLSRGYAATAAKDATPRAYVAARVTRPRARRATAHPAPPAPDPAVLAAAAAREADILKSGVAAQATVIRSSGKPPALVEYVLNVQPADGSPPFQTTVKCTTPSEPIPQPGAQLPVKVVAGDHSQVAIDWTAAAEGTNVPPDL